MIKDLISKFELKFKINLKLESQLNKISNSDFNFAKNKYQKILKTKFYINKKFSSRRKELNFLTIYKSQNRNIRLYSKKKITTNDFINNIDKICNFFNAIFDKNKRFRIDFYMFDDKKTLANNQDMPSRNNINSGSNLIEKGRVVIYRIEEWKKVLIHELIHYFDMHIFSIAKNLLYIYEDINSKSIFKPNEGYTEFLTLILYYQLFDSLKNLNKEIAWGFIQSAKILKLKGFESTEELFSGIKEYKQDTFLLSYFMLKTYFLFCNRYQKCIKLGSGNYNTKCFLNINLQQKKFSKIINYCIKNYNIDNSLKFSLT